MRRGLVADPSVNTDAVLGVRRLMEAVKGDPEVDATVLATVGSKGYDGFLYAVRN